MIPGMFPPGVASSGEDSRLLPVLQKLGLTTNLKLCLDARDALSYPSGQKWLDLSGGGYDFFLGANGSASSDDPTFVGTAGSLSAYWLFDGADFFTYDSASETWMNNLHKNNALWGFCTWIYEPGMGSSFFGNSGADVTRIGVDAGASGAAGDFFVGVRRGSNPAAIQMNGPNIGSGWSFVAASIDEAANASVLIVNTNVTTESAAYSSPSGSNASGPLKIGEAGNNNRRMPNGSRMACLAMWEGFAPSQADLTAIFDATKADFGL